MEIFRKEWDTAEGRETTSITAEFRADGSLRISGQDLGPSVERAWGDFDYEYWMTIRPEDLHRFVRGSPLRQAFNREGRVTFGSLRGACRQSGIGVGFGSWA